MKIKIIGKYIGIRKKKDAQIRKRNIRDDIKEKDIVGMSVGKTVMITIIIIGYHLSKVIKIMKGIKIKV